MAKEIERKFRVTGGGWKGACLMVRHIRQAYLSRNGGTSIRVRIDGSEHATLTIKTAAAGSARNEYEYPIPVADAEELLLIRCGALITKARHLVPAGDLTWEVDVFEGENAGLVMAEIELDRVDRQFERPDWIGEEVTGDRRFYNADLAVRPFSSW